MGYSGTKYTLIRLKKVPYHRKDTLWCDLRNRCLTVNNVYMYAFLSLFIAATWKATETLTTETPVMFVWRQWKTGTVMHQRDTRGILWRPYRLLVQLQWLSTRWQLNRRATWHWQLSSAYFAILFLVSIPGLSKLYYISIYTLAYYLIIVCYKVACLPSFLMINTCVCYTHL